ncbi:NACHT LRR and PYD domains-containing protein 12 [Dissostichus eleginoides]|uniref:NACHT LRR and PYD domains-containing protein 12 n=1 Tax=Dissostichus eleginoides TaxID=100907 RepID=A0AAD9BKK7_DISEL|nr:NACHT LRR and PYD domains-containing protein 12 [Dissostichus eleginoides]
MSTSSLSFNRITAVGCGSLSSALSGSSALKELHLSNNNLMDQGAIRISDLLRNPQCRLKILSGSSALKELDLSFNNLMDQGAIRISDLLRNPQCRLKILRLELLFSHRLSCINNTVLPDRLARCHFTKRGCAALASSLKSNPAHLRVLDLAQNKLQDGDVENLSLFLAEPLCQLETLDLNSCTLNVACLRSLTLAFSGSSALKELDLSYNRLMDEGAILLSDFSLSDSDCSATGTEFRM